MTNEKIARINELYKKSKAEGLSEEEKKEGTGTAASGICRFGNGKSAQSA